MNIIEAIKSGKKFKRPNFNEWLCIRSFDHCALSEFRYVDPADGKASLSECELRPVDVLADDWQVEEKKIEITEMALERAVDKILCLGEWTNIKSYLKKELGF